PPNSSLVTWSSPTDPSNPQNFPSLLRWTLITLVSLVTFAAGLSSSMFAPAVPAVMAEFRSTNAALASFIVTVYVLGLATGPLFFAPLSELYGRLGVQHVGNLGFLLFTVACAEARGLGTLVAYRLLQGIFAAVPLTNGGGIIADMVRQEERGFALAMFTLGLLFGSVVGPVGGGYLAAAEGWRWVFWVQAILIGIVFLASLILWRETYAPVLLERKAARLRLETGNSTLRTKYDTGLSKTGYFKRGISRVLKMLVFSPIVLAFAVYMGLMYSYFYLLVTILTPIYEDVYGFSSSSVGLSFLGIGVGFLLGQVAFAATSDRILKHLTERSQEKEMKPEYRLPPAIVGGICMPIAFFWFGWSAHARAHWVLPIIGTCFLGFGNSLIIMTIQSYSIDAFTVYAASALGANTVLRSVMAATLPLAAPKMFDTLGLGWGNSLLAFLALAMVPIPWLLYIYGERIR
ncbi:putative MFS multidrug transporter, partial [Patellaria atrata CBS 101060]